MEHGEELNEILSQAGGGAIFQTVIEYIIISEDDEAKVIEALQQTPPKTRAEGMSVAEQIELRGEKRGKEIERTRLVQTMSQNGASIKQIAELTGIEQAEIERIIKSEQDS